MAVGNSWTFQVVSSGVAFTKVQTVTGTVAVGDEVGYRVLTRRDRDRGTRSIQVIRDGRLERVYEETLEGEGVKARFRFEPAALRIDSTKVKSGDTYSDVHEKVEVDEAGTSLGVESKSHTFFVESGLDLVTVPAGTFECVRVRRVRADGSEKTYWYAQGLGKIREEGGQTEELRSSRVASTP